MKYISKESVIQAFDECRNKTQNKFWGLVSILRVLEENIVPAKSYSINVEKIQNFLEDLFRLEENKKNYNTTNKWSIIFSNQWIDNVPEQMLNEKPNVYSVATWCFRRTAFDENITPEQVVGNFLDLIHLTKDEAQTWFSYSPISITFENSIYNENDLFDAIVRKVHASAVPSNKTLSFEGQTFIKSNPGSLGQAPFIQTLYANQGIQKCLILTQFDFQELYPYNQHSNDCKTLKNLQQIFYGAPGTGKSNTIKRDVEDQGKIHFRTTFHPDSDYSTFVGCYKPTMKSVKKTVVIGQDEKEVKPLTGGTDSVEQISYQFVPQAFTKAYCESWNHYNEDEESEPVYLIIEEINRGNCAQIFGDIFQLLDRKNGFSEYPIDADEDLKKFLLNGTKDDGTPWLVNKKGIENGQLRLPANLHIWATMNTSDQSLFPIDSAFKRRWDWRYIKIKDEKKSWTIEGGHDWWKFLEKINKVVLGMTSSADKQLGYFFCKANDANNEISKETFVNKVCFYLWNDVFKSFYSDEYADLFKIKKDGNDGELTFPDFFDDNGNVDSEIAEQFIGNVMKFGESQDKPIENQEAQA